MSVSRQPFITPAYYSPAMPNEARLAAQQAYDVGKEGVDVAILWLHSAMTSA